jgi:hypothetical protein
MEGTYATSGRKKKHTRDKIAYNITYDGFDSLDPV